MLAGTVDAGEQLPQKGSKGGTTLDCVDRKLQEAQNQANGQPVWMYFPPFLRAAADHTMRRGQSLNAPPSS